MQFFRYFQRRKLVSSQQILEHLYKIKIHSSIWKNRNWLRSKMPKAYITRGFLYYPEKENGKVVQRKIWLYSKKMESMKPKSTIESILDELKIVD